MKAAAAAMPQPTQSAAVRGEVAPEAQRATRSSAQEVRALFVLSALAIGGSETKIVRVANELLSRGIRTGIACLNEPHDLQSALAPAIPVWHMQRRGKFSLVTAKALRRLVREQRPSALFAVNLYPALYVSFATAGLSPRPRTVGLINTSEFPAGSAWRASFYRPFLRRFDATVYGCELQRSHWVSQLHYRSDRSSVLYNGVDSGHFAPDPKGEQALFERQHLGIDPQSFVVGTVGRLKPEKNQAVLIDALAELRRRSIPAHLLVVGEGSLRAELERRAVQLQVQPFVTFAGVQRDVRPALAAMDVFVLPSTHVETFSNAALEAMSMAKPVVLSRIGGATEMVDEGVEGYTLPAGDLEQGLAPVLARLYATPESMQRMGESARRRVAREFSIERMVERYAALIDGPASEASH